MQAPTHILTGVAIQKAFSKMRNRTLAFILMAVCAFLSHGLLDKIAKMTYHPPNADFNDWIWVGYHFFFLLPVTIYFFYVFWRKYKWGILFSILPDFDWVFKYGQSIAGIEKPFYDKPYIHQFVHAIWDAVFPQLNNLPDLRFNYFTALVEILFVAIFYFYLRKREALKRSWQ